MNMDTRIDIALTERGLCKSRSRAKSLLQNQQVQLNGVVCTKPSTLVKDTDTLELIGEDLPFVGRGGLKLEEALQRFSLTLHDAVCLDIGASTGGFTDCMLQHGAACVYAIDVGHDQLDPALRVDPRVKNMENTDIRTLRQADLERMPTFASIDVSFISLELILPAAHALLAETADCVALIKPQFQAGREHIGKKGIVKSAKVHRQVLTNVLSFAQQIGFSVHGLCPSPIRGGSGNAEYLVYLKKGSPASVEDFDIANVVAQAGVSG